MTAGAAPLLNTDFQAAQRDNETRTAVLAAAMMTLLWSFGYVLGWGLEGWWREAELSGGQGGVAWILFLSVWGLYGAAAAVVAGTVAVIVALWQADALMLRLTDGRLLEPGEEPRLRNVVEEMAIAAGAPMPRLAIIETPALNAFAYGTGPERAVVGVTRGLIDTLSRDELQGVVAHEIAHILNEDIRHATFASVIAGTIALVAELLARGASGRRTSHRSSSDGRGNAGLAVLALIVVAFVILAPIVAKLLQMAMSREREYLADATSVRLTRNPLGLIGALEKLDAGPPLPGALPAAQHLFIVNPRHHVAERAGALMSTHPPTKQRIARLRDLGG